MGDISRYYTIKDVAKRLDVAEDWVRDLIRVKQLRAVKMGKWRINPKEVKRFIISRSNLV